MILVLSTSSPSASSAWFTPSGELLYVEAELAPRAASGALLRQIDRSGMDLREVTLFVADVGPGSFTGVRVGVTLAKTWGFVFGRPVAAVSAFDLIDPSGGPAVIPSKRGEWFVRLPNEEPARCAMPPIGVLTGYGVDGLHSTYPDPARLAEQLGSLSKLPAESLVPVYIAEPSISLPKRAGVAEGGLP